MPRRNASHRRRGSKQRKVKPVFFIATEGTVTERLYIDALLQHQNYTIKFCKPNDSRTDPLQVLAKLEAELPPKKQRREHDQYWIVCDVEDGRNTTKIDQLVAHCNREGYQTAISNICFELWLLLHQQTPPCPTGAGCCDDYNSKCISQIDGYQKKNLYEPEKLKDKLELAIGHAKKAYENFQQQNTNVAWPREIDLTTFYNLVNELKKQQ